MASIPYEEAERRAATFALLFATQLGKIGQGFADVAR